MSDRKWNRREIIQSSVIGVQAAAIGWLALRDRSKPDETTGIGAMGWVDDPDGRAPVAATMPAFAETPAFRAVQGDEPKAVYLWDAYRRLNGINPPERDQGGVGSCVSFGTAAAIEATLANQIFLGFPGEFRDVAQEVIYAGSRVEIGGGRIRGDGSIGAWAAKFVVNYGIIARGVALGYDLTRYDESRCRGWGRSGVPDDLEREAKKFPVKDAAAVQSWSEAKRALVNAYGIAICSNRGFTMARDSRGICKPSGTWAHCYTGENWISGPTYRRIRDIKPGHTVYDHNGDERAVTEVFSREYSGNLARISVKGGVQTSMTEDHPVLVYRRVHHRARTMVMAGVVAGCEGDTFPGRCNQNFAPAWVHAKDVRPGDYLVSPAAATSDPISPRDGVEPSSELAWLFGFLIGDGYAVRGHKIGLRIGRSKPWRRAIEAFRLLGLKATIKRNPTFVEIRAYNSDLATWFSETFYDSDRQKIIPDWLMNWDRESLIEGLMAADGCNFKGRMIYSTISESLALQVRQILIGLGHRVVMNSKMPGKGAYANGKRQFGLEYRPDATRGSVQIHEGSALLKVKSILLLPYSGTVHNIEVEEAHSYIAGGYATHNCMALDGYHIDTDGREYGHITNSWGARAHTGPVGWGNPNLAGFWTDSKTIDGMLRQDDSWAFSGVTGFPARQIDWNVMADPRINRGRLLLA